MQDHGLAPAVEVGCVSLVDGDPALRRARQLMLRAEHYEVKAYPTCNALLADIGSIQSACLVAELEMPGIDGFELLDQMRVNGWRGSAILLANAPLAETILRAADMGAALLPNSITDRLLLDAISAAIQPARRTGAR